MFALLFGVGVALLDQRYRERVFPPDVVDCFICFVGINLCPSKPTRFLVSENQLTD
jgi:xanthine/uracil permease